MRWIIGTLAATLAIVAVVAISPVSAGQASAMSIDATKHIPLGDGVDQNDLPLRMPATFGLGVKETSRTDLTQLAAGDQESNTGEQSEFFV